MVMHMKSLVMHMKSRTPHLLRASLTRTLYVHFPAWTGPGLAKQISGQVDQGNRLGMVDSCTWWYVCV